MIDPNIWQSEDFSKLSNLSKLCFIGLFSNADDEGYGKANPIYIKSILFPFEEKVRAADIEKSLLEIAANMSVVFYTALDGKDYYVLTNWDKWQSIQKPTESRIPKLNDTCKVIYCEKSGITVGVQEDYNSTTVGVQPNKNRKEKEKNRKEYMLKFEKFWSEYPKKVGKPKAEAAFEKLNVDDMLLEKMLNAIKIAKNTEQWQIEKGKFIPYPASWINGRRWEDELDVCCDNKKSVTVVQAPKGIFNGYKQKAYSEGELEEILRRKNGNV